MHGERLRYDLAAAGAEASQCRDLLSQAQYHVARARRLDNDERQLKQQQEEQMRKLQERISLERSLKAKKLAEDIMAKVVKGSNYSH